MLVLVLNAYAGIIMHVFLYMCKTSQFYTVKVKVFFLLAEHFRNILVYLMSAGNSEPYQIFDQRDPDDRKSVT